MVDKDISIIYDYIVVDMLGWETPVIVPQTGTWPEVESPLTGWTSMLAGLVGLWTLISPQTGLWTEMGGIEIDNWTEVPT